MNHPFQPGQRVICVADDFPYAVFEMFDAVPWQGGVFTISEVTSGKNYRTGRFGPSIRLVEFPPLQPGHGSFHASRFRLLEEELKRVSTRHHASTSTTAP